MTTEYSVAELLAKIEKLEAENKRLRDQVIDLQAERLKSEEYYEESDELYTEIYNENKFLKSRVDDLEKAYDTINIELKRYKAKFETNTLEQFMNIYGALADRCEIKVIQQKYLEQTGIKHTQKQLKQELEQLGYAIKINGRNGISSYVSKNTNGYLYIVQLKKHSGTNIFKVGRTVNMEQRLNLYKRYEGGANEIALKKVKNQFKAEAKLLQILNEAASRNEIEKNEYGEEYFEGPLETIRKYYDEVVAEEE